MPSITKQSKAILSSFFVFVAHLYSGNPSLSEIQTIKWATHFGPSSSVILHGNNPSSTQLLYGLNAAGATATALAHDNATPDNTGDLIQLGFFDTDTDANTWTPNDDASNMFNGTWTPLLESTTIGHKTSSGDSFVGAGSFAFQTEFYNSESSTPSADVYDATGPIYWDQISQTNKGVSTPYKIAETSLTDLYKKVDALAGASDPYIGIRFYDLDTGSNAQGSNANLTPDDGTSRYNTIMNPNWIWPDGGNTLEMSLHTSASNGPLDTNLKFEFENTTYGTHSGAVASALIGTGGNSLSSADPTNLHTDDFVATVTYYDGAGGLTLSDSGIGDSILSGLSGSGDLNGANDGNQLTIHSNSGRTDEFTGTITNGGTNVTDLTVLKTGSGGQTFTGVINVADSDSTESGFLNVMEGTVTLKPGNSVAQKFEFLTNSKDGGTTYSSGSTLALDNSSYADQAIELGFANTAEKRKFTGAISLLGSNTENTVSIGGTTNSDAHQEFSGAISGTNKFKKAGIGKLTLSGDSNGYAGDGTDGITIGDSSANGGILVAAHNDALGSNDVTIAYGKLAVAGGVTVTNTIVGESSTSQKSIVGGGSGTSVGTITNGGAVLNIGSGSGEIDVVSPGIALSTSLSTGTSTQQSIAGDHNDAGVDTLAQSIGIVKINSVGLKSGGVYDWEIANFDGSTPGTDWDVLQFDSLAFDSSGNFDLNILSLTSNDGAGSGAGAVAGTIAGKSGTSGFKFLDGSGSNGSGITWGSIAIGGSQPSGSGTLDSGYFNFGTGNFSYYNNSSYYGDWSVYLDYANNDFYLQYSVVPEPSTYIMVAGLLMLPGMSYLRRLRKSGSEEEGSI
jgi:hypothetical protein